MFGPFPTRNWVTKLQAFNLLGGRCVRCGADDPRVLQIDHIYGQIGRKKDERGHHLALKIIQGKIRLDMVQLMCANCHQKKTFED